MFLHSCEYMYMTNYCMTDRKCFSTTMNTYMYMTNYCVTDCMVGVFLQVPEHVTCIQYMTNKRATNWSVSGSIC